MNNASHEVIGKQSTFTCGKDREHHNKPQFEYSFNQYVSDSLTIKEFGFYKIRRMRGEIEGVLPTEVDNILLDRTLHTFTDHTKTEFNYVLFFNI